MKTVLVDVYAWLKAIETHGSLVIEGVFRNAVHLCRYYTPAVFLAEGEKVTKTSLLVLQNHIRKPIQVIMSMDQLNEMCSVWFSLAVDFPSPVISSPDRSFLRASIINDVFAYQGHFGEAKKKIYEYGATNFDLGFYISETAINAFHELSLNGPGQKFCHIGCAHLLDKLSDPPPSRYRDRAVSLFSVYPRKNLTGASNLANMLRKKHFHIGRIFDTSADDMFDIGWENEMRYLGTPSDEEVKQVLAEADTFICMSRAEGFSIPPMEAILAGVPNIWLSNIDVHIEIYGDYPVNFLAPTVEAREVRFRLSEENVFTEYYRFSMFEEHHPKKVHAPMLALLKEYV